MSLRKSPRLTPQLLAAARQNARHATGPRSPAAKQNSKLNALKHGERSNPENHYQVMRALGEDPEEFESLKQELMTSFGPGDALWEKQIDDLARLYWRRDRLERAQEGLMRRALLAVDEWQHRRRREMAGATFDASQSKAIDIDMTEPTDPGVRLRMLLSFLGVIREQVKQRTFKPRQASEIETLYRGKEGWRQARLCYLLWLFRESVKRSAQDKELEELPTKDFGPREQAGEPQYQELLRLLDEETASVQEEFQYAEKVNEEKAAIERDACLAPVGDQWGMMLRREGALDRSIDRKIRILLSLRKGYATGQPQEPQTLEGRSALPGDDDPSTAPAGKAAGGGAGIAVHAGDTGCASIRTNVCAKDQSEIPRGVYPERNAEILRCAQDDSERARNDTDNLVSRETMENKKINERSGNVIENKGPLLKSPDRGWNVYENKAGTPGMRECC